MAAHPFLCPSPTSTIVLRSQTHLGIRPDRARRLHYRCPWGWRGIWAAGLAIGAGLWVPSPVSAQGITSETEGTGTIVTPIATPSGSEYQITGGTQSGSNLFHSFEQFGLNAGDIANFIGSPDLTNILGRVTGGNASVINGLVQVSNSSANLYLMNPAGLIFGPGASLDLAGSFTGTTATAIGFDQGWFNAIGNNNYATLIGSPNQFQFAAATAIGTGLLGGSIVNVGTLSVEPGQSLALLGRAVFNSGTLSAPRGQIAIVAVPAGASGTETQVLRYTEPGMILSLELTSLPSSADPLPLATLDPRQLPAYLTGGDSSHASALIVEADGTVRLTSEVLPVGPGTVMLSGNLNTAIPTDTTPSTGTNTDTGTDTGTDTNTGTNTDTDITNTAGGTVVVTGKTVGLLNATVTTSGEAGGGQIRIGGEAPASAETAPIAGATSGGLPTATVTYVDAASRLIADAVFLGNGGEITVWANDTTRFYGSASARGGSEGGNGGVVETSGQRFFDLAGARVDTTAPSGDTGLWILDPSSITLVGGSSGGSSGTTTAPNFTTAAAGLSSQLRDTDLAQALATNTVIVTTSGGGDNEGDILFDSSAGPITLSGAENSVS